MYVKGQGVKQSFSKAVYWYGMAVRQNHPTAQNNLATLYFNGPVAIRNISEATKLYQQASRQGHPGAQINLAIIYETGNGLKKDPNKAIHLYQMVVNNSQSSNVIIDFAKKGIKRINEWIAIE